MNELVALFIAYFSLIIISLVVYKSTMLLHPLVTLVILMGYWVVTYYYYGLLLWLNSLLTKREIYIDFGHADTDLLVFMGFCWITVLIFTIVIIVNKGRKTFQ
jgi:hypothetical protein